MIEIRPATTADLDPIRRLHTDSWRDAYAPFVPVSALDRLDAEMAERWARLPGGVICACAGRRIVGFVRLKRRQGWPYIDNLHTVPDLRGQGIGGLLMGAAGQALHGQGSGRVWLTVIAENLAAQRFYTRHGGQTGAPMLEPVLGHPTATRPVIWNRLAPLLAKKPDLGRDGA